MSNFMGLLVLLLCSSLLLAGTTASRHESSLPAHLQSHPAFSVGHWRHIATQTPHPDSLHSFTLTLKPQQLDLLQKHFWAVSTPQSPRYGQYLSAQEIAAIVARDPKPLTSVVAWLKQHHIQAIDVFATQDALRVRAPVRIVEQLFGVRLRAFAHRDGRTLLRAWEQELKVPSHIAAHLDLVRGIHDFPVPSKKRSPLLRASSPSHSTETHHTATKTSAHKQSSAPSTHYRLLADAPAPVVTSVVTRGAMSVTFTPTCSNGAPTHALPPCSDVPDASPLSAIVVTADPVLDTHFAPRFTTELAVSDVTCTTTATNVTCSVSFPARVHQLAYYEPYNVSISLIYEAGMSPSGYNRFPTINTPPVTPQTLASLYSIPPNYVVKNQKATQCVVEFEQQYYSQADLEGFFHDMGLPDDAAQQVTVIGPNLTPAGGEANLDIQYIMGVAVGAPTVFWSIYANSSVEIDDILSWALAIGNMTNPPLVNSLSYGMSAANVDTYLGAGYLARSDVEFQKLALMGLSVIIASGDTGAGDLGDLPMGSPTCEVLNPDWPSQSPYVTSVGATAISPLDIPVCYLPASSGGVDCSQNPLGEITVSLEQGIFYTSGGGFSNSFSTRPAYQDTLVNVYLKKSAALGLLPPSNMWNSSSRGYPDVSAVGHNLIVKLDGTYVPVDGTSASAPIFAGVVTLLNEVRLNAGLSPLGFLNPLLYSLAEKYPQAFNDVTIGSNRCGAYGFEPLCCTDAFKALPGWDACTGLGTPSFRVLSELVLQKQA